MQEMPNRLLTHYELARNSGCPPDTSNASPIMAPFQKSEFPRWCGGIACSLSWKPSAATRENVFPLALEPDHASAPSLHHGNIPFSALLAAVAESGSVNDAPLAGKARGDNQSAGSAHQKDQIMIHRSRDTFNLKKPTFPENLPDMDALRAAWRTLASREASSPPGCRLGIALRRMELLAAFPENEHVAVLDRLNETEVAP